MRNTIALSVKAIPQFTHILNKLYQDFQVLRAADDDGVGEQSPKQDNPAEGDSKKAAPPKKEEKNGGSSSKGAKEEKAQKVE